MNRMELQKNQNNHKVNALILKNNCDVYQLQCNKAYLFNNLNKKEYFRYYYNFVYYYLFYV